MSVGEHGFVKSQICFKDKDNLPEPKKSNLTKGILLKHDLVVSDFTKLMSNKEKFAKKESNLIMQSDSFSPVNKLDQKRIILNAGKDTIMKLQQMSDTMCSHSVFKGSIKFKKSSFNKGAKKPKNIDFNSDSIKVEQNLAHQPSEFERIDTEQTIFQSMDSGYKNNKDLCNKSLNKIPETNIYKRQVSLDKQRMPHQNSFIIKPIRSREGSNMNEDLFKLGMMDQDFIENPLKNNRSLYSDFQRVVSNHNFENIKGYLRMGGDTASLSPVKVHKINKHSNSIYSDNFELFPQQVDKNHQEESINSPKKSQRTMYRSNGNTSRLKLLLQSNRNHIANSSSFKRQVQVDLESASVTLKPKDENSLHSRKNSGYCESSVGNSQVRNIVVGQSNKKSNFQKIMSLDKSESKKNYSVNNSQIVKERTIHSFFNSEKNS